MEENVSDTIRRMLTETGYPYPFLRNALDILTVTESGTGAYIAADGLRIVFGKEYIPCEEDLQHAVIHCLFGHLKKPPKAVMEYWDAACDISAEYIRTEMFPSEEGDELRLRIRDALPTVSDPRSSEEVYRAVMDSFEEDLSELRSLTKRDLHRCWYEPFTGLGSFGAEGRSEDTGGTEGKELRSFSHYDREKAEESPGPYEELIGSILKEVWPSGDELPGGRAVTGEYGLSPGCREERAVIRARAKYDFSRYLRRFSTMKEEMRLDMSDFDYIPYCYGVERYGNMPFIEPLEYAESHKVEDLVIAIDTSGSCSLETVERFLSEIERILLRKENFFRRMNVHMIQCDARVQDHRVIHSAEEWKEYAKDIYIRGRGGTDFNPVFELTERLRKSGRLRELKGLLYFTDGNGVYPQKKTDYETAFVFTTKAALSMNIPEWITPLCLDMEEEEKTSDIFRSVIR